MATIEERLAAALPGYVLAPFREDTAAALAPEVRAIVADELDEMALNPAMHSLGRHVLYERAAALRSEHS